MEQFNTWLNHLRYLKREGAYSAYDTWRWLSHRRDLARVINQTEIRFIGLRRCGNHAVLNWIRKQAGGTVCFLNNVEPDMSPFRFYHLHFPKDGYRSEAWGRFSQKDWLIYSYEDHSLRAIATQRYERNHDLYVGKTQARYNVLLLRDPFNWLASRLKKDYRTVKTPGETLVSLWIEQAKEFLGETNLLPHPTVAIRYNQWFSDEPYRRAIAHQLGLNFSDDGMDYVGSYGGGSSFEGMALTGQAQAMDVINRWRHFQDDDRFRALIANEELLHYSEQIFGAIAGTEELIRSARSSLTTAPYGYGQLG